MSPQLYARCAMAVLAAALLASAMGLLAWGPVPMSIYLNGVQDTAGTAETLAAWTVWGPVPALAAAAVGWHVASGVPQAVWRRAWRTGFAASAAAVATAAFEHAAPGALGPLVVHMTAASACAAVSLLFVAERLGQRWVSRPALLAAVLAGPAAGALCGLSEVVTGTMDVRSLLWLQALPLVVVPLGVWGLHSGGLSGFDWLVALALLCVSEAMHWVTSSSGADRIAHAALEGVHHVALAAALGWLAFRLGRELRAQALWPRGAATGPASQRSTSRSTSLR